MKNAVTELFTRFVAGFPHGEDAILRADQIQAGELPTPARPPVHTVLVKGKQGQAEELLAVVAMTVPSLSPEDPALLELYSPPRPGEQDAVLRHLDTAGCHPLENAKAGHAQHPGRDREAPPLSRPVRNCGLRRTDRR